MRLAAVLTLLVTLPADAAGPQTDSDCSRARLADRATAITRCLEGDAIVKDLPRLELRIRDLLSAFPNDLELLERLARAQEAQELFDSAEQSLLWARQLYPGESGVYRLLAEFYARRAVATMAPPRPDENGVYRPGAAITEPRRVSGTRVPPLPAAATAAGVTGPVMLEFTVTAAGTVGEVRIVFPVPLLEQIAVDTVRSWRFAPGRLNGQPVPVRLSTILKFE